MLDFTLEKYQELCISLLNAGYTALTISEYLESRKRKKFVILRHDVDRKPENASGMAKLEAGLGIKSTYYFRYPYTFKPALIKNIADYGHEIGYHYETLSKTKGDYAGALALFESELAQFRAICEVKTICMHGSPLSKFDNRDLWKVYDFKDYGLTGEAYLSFTGGFNYFSDTGRGWASKNKMRDFLQDSGSIAKSTDELIGIIRGGNYPNFYIVAHSERWALNYLDWCASGFKDIIFNTGKKLIWLARKSNIKQ